MIIPMLVCIDPAKDVQFYQQAFGAVELSRRQNDAGKVIHVTLKIVDALFMLHDESPHLASVAPKSDGSSPVVNYLFVEQVDAVIERAQAAGAVILMPLENQMWGARVGRIMAPSGHVWNISSHVSTE